MATQYTMTALLNGTSRIYWVVTGAPDTTGAQSGYNITNLSNITTDYSVSLPTTSTGGSTIAAAVTRIPPDGYDILVWPLNDTAAPYVNTGTLGSAGNLTTTSGTIRNSRTGIMSNCADFAVTSYTYSAAGATTNPSSSLFSVHGWIKIRAAQGASNWGRVFTKWSDSTGTYASAPDAFSIVVNASSTALYVQGHSGGALKATSITSRDTIPLNTWTHLGVTFNAGTVKLYLNGDLILTDATWGATVNFTGVGTGLNGTPGPWSLGGSPIASSGIDGELNDWRVSSGIERSAAYFQQIYQAGTGITPAQNVITEVASNTVMADGYANLPPAGLTGRLFIPAGGSSFLRDTGTAWQAYGPITPIVVPPTVTVGTNFSWLNQQSAILTNSTAGIFIQQAGVAFASTQLSGLYQTGSGSASMFVECGSKWFSSGSTAGTIAAGSNSSYRGCMMYESSTGKFCYMAVEQQVAAGSNYTSNEVIFMGYSSGTTVIGSHTFPATSYNAIGNASEVYLRLRLSGANIIGEMSIDRVNWIQLSAGYSVAKTTAFTTGPDKVGICFVPYGNNNGAQAITNYWTFFHYNQG